MATFFHVVQMNKAPTPGLTLSLFEIESLPPHPQPELTSHVRSLFPDGLSHHGLGHFFYQDPCFPEPGTPLTRERLGAMRSQSIELLWEYVRRAMWPSRPSRMQSVFASPTRADAETFRDRYRGGQGEIWKIEGE